MASQLIYTSAAKLLDAGRSGFGTVARSKATSPLVVSAIERVSQFANQRGTDRSRMIFVHRRILVANQRCHVLSRICDAGADYTGRTNHIAHHLILSPDEVARTAARGVTPADVLRQFAWRDRWDEPARYFSPDEEVAVDEFRPLGRQAAGASWSAVTGQSAHARLFAWDGAPRTGVLLVPHDADPLALLAEALSEFGNQAWSRTFTTALESTDELSDIDWIVTTPAVFPEIQGRCGARVIFDLSQPATLPLPPAPVMAAPAVAPASAATEPIAAGDGTGMSAGGRSAARVQLNRARLAPGRNAPAEKIVIPTVRPTKSIGIWLVAGSATVVISIVLAVAVWKTLQPSETKVAADEPPAARLTDSQQDAVDLLKNAGIALDNAETIAKKSGAEAREWATFITNFCRAIQRASPVGQLPQPPAAREPDGVPAWLTTLTTVRHEIGDFLSDSTNDADLTKRLGALQRIHAQLRSVTVDLAAVGLTAEACDALDCVLVAAELERLPTGRPGVKADPFRLQAAIADGQFSQASFPDRHRLLVTFVGKRYGLNETQATTLADTGTFSNRPRQPLDPAPMADRTPDLSQLKLRTIQLVSRDQLAQGVAVELLRQVMKSRLAPGAAQVKLAPLTISLSPPDRDQQATDLYLSDDKGYYCWTKIKTDRAPHYALDGRFSLKNPAIRSIHFQWAKHEAIVVVNEPGDEWIRDDLSAQLQPRGEGAVLTGELADWLRAVIGDEPAPVPLEMHLVPENPNLSITADAAGWRVGLRSQVRPGVVFSELHAEGVATALAAFKATAELSGSTQNAKREIEQERKKALAKLQQSLCIAIGGGLLSRDLKVADASQISDGQLGEIRKSLTEKYQISGKPAQGDLAEVAEAIGQRRLDEELPKLGKKVPWSELAKESASGVWVEGQIQAVLKDAKPSQRPSSLAGELNKVTHLTIKTPAGRALFKATRN